jgi:hypothetical protein
MDKKGFLAAAERGRGPKEQDGMHTRTRFYVMVGGEQVLLKEAHEVFDDAGNKTLDVRVARMACGHSVEDQKDVVSLDGKLYCLRCVHRCPACGSYVVPGTGRLIGQGTPEAAWYHEACAEPYLRHAEIKRVEEENLLAARTEAARQQALLGGVQVRAAEVGVEKLRLDMHVQKVRLRIEQARERVQRRLIAAQAHSVRESLRLQEENLGLQRDRLVLESLQAAERMEMERGSQALKEKAQESQLASEELQREIARAGLESARHGDQLPGPRKQIP